MDYINYVKRSPVQGLTGLYGGVQGSLMAAGGGGGGGAPADGAYFGNRGLHLGGNNSPTDVIGYFNIPTTQNASNFGTLTAARLGGGAASNETRSVSGFGYQPGGYGETLDYVTVSSTGNATNFGDGTQEFGYCAACSSGGRGVWGAGYTGSARLNSMEHVTIATTGDAEDFGDLSPTFGSGNGGSAIAGGSNGERGIWYCGHDGSGGSNVIQYFNIENLGNAQDFGDSTTSAWGRGAVSNTTRMIAAGGYYSDDMDYITIASTGNASNFGELTTNGNGMGGANNASRGVFMGGEGAGNVLQYVTFSSTGNSTDFGDSVNTGNNNYMWGDSGGGT